jgi:hypothetical protein
VREAGSIAALESVKLVDGAAASIEVTLAPDPA